MAELGRAPNTDCMARPAFLPSPLAGAGAANVIYLGAARAAASSSCSTPTASQDETYLVAERAYKERAHLEWEAELGPGDLPQAAGARRVPRDRRRRRAHRVAHQPAVLVRDAWRCATRVQDAGRRPAVRHRAVRLPLRPRLAAAPLQRLGARRVADLPQRQAPRADLAGGHGVRLHRAARPPPVLQAARHAQGRARATATTSATSREPAGRSTRTC